MSYFQFTSNLNRFFPSLEPGQAQADSVHILLGILEEKYPGLTQYLCDDQGSLRKHVNIFVNGELIRDRTSLADHLDPNSQVFIVQALSGG